MGMIDKKKPESTEPSETWRRSLAGFTRVNDLWPFVVSALGESTQTIRARSAAIFLRDGRSDRMRTEIGRAHV